MSPLFRRDFQQWVPILGYAAFGDVPRAFWTRRAGGGLWLLDCPFDDAADDYRKVFTVHEWLGSERAFSADMWHEIVARGSVSDTLDVGRLEFDATRRASVRIKPERLAEPG